MVLRLVAFEDSLRLVAKTTGLVPSSGRCCRARLPASKKRLRQDHS